MGISISGSNAISGLGGNDTDFDKVLSQLKKIEQTQLNRLEAWKSDWNLRYEGFTQIIEQIQAASSMLSQLSDKNNFVTKLVQSTNDNVVTAVANASAQDVQHTIKVSQVASNAIWANTGHVFDSRTDIINTTGEDQYFSYTYAGKRHDFKVPANTTLDSFVSMINNSADNPGIKVSLIQTGNGYVFQVAGKDTGVENDLIIHDSNLVGMSATGSTSTWQTNSTIDTDDILTNPNTYVFDIVLQGGTKKSVAIKGTATPDEVVAALSNAAGGLKASVDANNNLAIEGAQSISIRNQKDDPHEPGGIKLTVPGGEPEKTKLNDAGGLAAGLKDDDILEIEIAMSDGKTRTVSLRADSTNKDLMVALAQATQEGTSANIVMESNGLWSISLANVAAITPSSEGGEVNASAISASPYESKGVLNSYSARLSATTTITFDKDKLDKRIDGLEDGAEKKSLTFMVVMEDGTTQNITIDSDGANQALLDKIKEDLGITAEYGVDADGNTTLELAGIKEVRLSQGSVKDAGWETSLKSSLFIPAKDGEGNDNLFQMDDASGQMRLEKAPDLVYTFTTNSGATGTLTLASGSAMADVVAALQNPADPTKWVWKDADGNDASAPADWEVAFDDPDGAGKGILSFNNVQMGSGPGISGQISASSNWNIQRSANARYQVDNWPIEMESASNRITDVIEGVVFSIQDVGEARLTVSTDITSVEQSIQNFLDAVNSVLLTVNDLMKYDETKQVTSNDPNDIGNDNYSASGLTNQKGSLLTGNYGVQLFKSRFSSVLGATPPGFKSLQTASDLLSGDLLSSLANLGIKTDTDSTSDTYGLLVLAPSSGIAAMQEMDKDNYNKMITDHLEAVVDFFCASGSGSSTSTDFRYGSHVEGITKPGTYNVTYKVDESGGITEVYVGGVKATRDESQPGNYYSVASGDARGLSILIDDLTVGDHPPVGGEPLQVRIKQGLVQTVNSFLKDELVFNDVNIPANATKQEIEDAIALKSKNGALMSLRANYKAVMESIDVKIEREQRRISTWEARQKKIFANLETLLNQYGEQQKQLEGQLAQLGGD